MRRIVAVLLALLMLPVGALAASGMPYAPETVLHTALMSEGVLVAIGTLYPAILRGEELIELPDGMRYDDVNAAMNCLSRNYPELFHLENNWAIGYYQDTPAFATVVRPSYTMSPAEHEALLARLLETAQGMVDAAAGSQADRAEVLHDWLCERVAYDRSETLEADNTAVGALLMGESRCEGYALSLTLLYRLAGIPCGVVTGDAGIGEDVQRHAWNAAVIDGSTVLIDATWDDQEENGCVTHWYYGLTATQMAADHSADPEFNLAAADSMAVNWHARRGLLVSERTGLLAAIGRFAVEGEVSIRFTDAALYADLVARTNEWIDEYNAMSAPGEAFYGSYGMIWSEEQQCVLLRTVKEDTP